MSNFKASLFVTVALISTALGVDAEATTRVTPISQTTPNQPAQGVADAAAGPTTGGGDTPYLSVQPTKPGAEPAKPADSAPAQAATPVPAPVPDAAAAAPVQPADPVKTSEPVTPPVATPAPAAAEAPPTPAVPPTTPASTEKSQEAQPAATPVPAAAPASPPPAPATPVQAATPVPEAPVPAAAPSPQPAPETPVQAATPTPVTPATPVPAAAPSISPAAPETPVQAATPAPAAPASPAPTVAIQPQITQPVPGAQDQKPKQQLAKKKPKPVHKPDVVVRTVPKVPLYRAPDDNVMVYEDGPVPPMPIGRHRVVIETDNGYDGDYVVVRHYRPCERHFGPGFWFFHREARCD